MRLAALAFLIACSQNPSAPAPAPAAKTIAERTAADLDAIAAQAQLQQGKQLFAEHCASCHGDAGQGTEDGPALVGDAALPREPLPGAKRTVVFRSGTDVLAFAAQNMPADDPGALSRDQYVAIVTFVLAIHGTALDRPL